LQISLFAYTVLVFGFITPCGGCFDAVSRNAKAQHLSIMRAHLLRLPCRMFRSITLVGAVNRLYAIAHMLAHFASGRGG
jgi:hypothetical protein